MNMTKKLTLFIGFVVLLLFAVAPVSFGAETVVYSQGFETDNGGYTIMTPGASANWQWGTPPATPGPGGAHGGSRCWGTNFGARMPRPADQSIVSPAIKLPRVSADQIIRVRFWAFVSLDGMYDRAQFFVSKDGQTWESLAQLYNNMETSCNITPGWHKYEFTINNSYAQDPNPNNNVIYLRIRAAVQYSNPTFYCPPNTADDLSGVYFDDVAIMYYDLPAVRKVFTLEGWEDPGAWASCPWVAPWNGSQFQVDNDIYSVARMPGSDYRDYYRLNAPLVMKDGVYPIEIQERETEDSYTDFAALLEIDHAPDVAVAPDEKGSLHAYRLAGLLSPVSALANGQDVSAELSTADNNGFAAYNGDTVTVNFGTANIANNATLVLRVKGFVLGDGPAQPYSGPPAVIVETLDGSGAWQERGRLLPRFEFSTAAFDLKSFLAAGQPVTVRLRSVSHDIKYHLIDYAGLYAGTSPAFTATQVAPSRATFGAQDVLGALLAEDGNYAALSSGNKISLEFPVAQLAAGNVREFVFVSKGYYVPKGGSYLIYTWDGTGWVQRDGRSFTGSDTAINFDLSLFLPDPEGKYRVRIWQDYQYEGAAIDYVKMMVGTVEAPLLSAFDHRYNSDVTSKLATSDNNADYWIYCPRDRVVDVEFTPSGRVNIPPATNPVVATNLTSLTPTISWTYADADGDSQAKSEVQVWTGPGATGTIVWNPPEFTGAGTSVVYAGNALQAGIPYYARVRANDGQDWGAWSESAPAVALPRSGNLNGPYVAIVGNDTGYDGFYCSPKHQQFLFDQGPNGIAASAPICIGGFPPVTQYTRVGGLGCEQFRSQTPPIQPEVCDTRGTGRAPTFTTRGLSNAKTPAGNAGWYEWWIRLPEKPSGEINIVIECGVVKPNAFAVYDFDSVLLCAAETGERIGYGVCVRQEVDPGVSPVVNTALPKIKAVAYPGPYNDFLPFNLTAWKNPSAYTLTFDPVTQAMANNGNSQVLDGSSNTRILLKTCMDKTVITKLPVTGQLNALGQAETDLEAGDLIYVRMDVPRQNTVDIYCHEESARLQGVGEAPF